MSDRQPDAEPTADAIDATADLTVVDGALRESEAMYRSLVAASDEGVCIVEVLFDDEGDPEDYRFLVTNPAFEAHTGLRDAVGKRMRELEPQHERHWFESYGRVARTGVPERFTNIATHLGERWFDVYAFRVGRPEQRRVAILFRDISAQRQSEEALRRSEERYRLLVESVTEYAMLMMDPEGRITMWNSAAERLFGYREEEAAGMSGAALFVPEDRADGVPERELAQAARVGRANDDRDLLRKDGSRFFAHGATTALRHPDGSLRGFAKVLRDSTERKRTEDELRRLTTHLEARVASGVQEVRRLASELTLAEGRERHRIALLLHDDLQQQLHAMQFALHDLERLCAAKGGEEEKARIEEIRTLIRTAVEVTRSLSSDLSPPVLQGEGLIEVLRWLASRTREQHGLSVELESPPSLSVPHEALRVMLYQVVRELLFNVKKHAGADAARVVLAEDGELRIEVHDDGVGFDPVAVGSSLDGATGLGLHSIRNRVRFFGGELDVVSEPGRGTCVTVRLPRSSLTLG